jgi:hypothetical protein
MSAVTPRPRPLARWQSMAAGLLALLALLACMPTGAVPAKTTTTASSTPASGPTTDPSTLTLNVALTPGPGALFMPAMTAGLDKLSAYRATLLVSFAGTNAGQAEVWSKTYTMLVVNQPLARQLSITTTTASTAAIADPLPQTEIGGVRYTGGGPAACAAQVVGADTPALAESEPAALLPGLLGADEAGSATVNQMATKHYTFDARALALNDGQAYTGEAWVAADGGYLVKYTLEGKGGPANFGEGVSGTMTWDYNLTDVNQPAAIGVPSGCPLGQLEVSAMPGAQNVVKTVGQLAFDLPSATIDAVLAYYKNQLTAAGWAAGHAPQIEPGQMGTAAFTKGDRMIAVIVSLAAGQTSVSLSLSSTVPNVIK